jgi:nicotinate-nucleotide adenylyltransferase
LSVKDSDGFMGRLPIVKKIGIFGGAFNPVHYGHLRTAEDILEILSLDKVIFIPAGKPPFNKPGMAKASHRYEMVKAAIRGNPRFSISGIEVNNRRKSYTVDTIKHLKKLYERSELYFVLGIDAFVDMPSWKHPEKLVDMTNLVIISRPGYSFQDLYSSPFVKDVSKRMLRELDRGNRREYSFDISGEQKGYMCRVTALNISASSIRNLISNGKNINYLLPDSVKSYIISNKLYA